MTATIPLVYFDKGKPPRVVAWDSVGEPVKAATFIRDAAGRVHAIECREDGVHLDGQPVRTAREAFWPGGMAQRVGGPRRPPPKPPKVKPCEGMGRDPIPTKPRQKAKKAPPKRERPWWEAEGRESCPYFNPPGRGESVVAENNATVLVLRATTALRAYLRAYERGGYLAPWLRDGKRHRVVDAQDQAYARGDKITQEVAGRLLALTGEQREAVRRAAGVGADIGRVKPEGGT